MERRWTSLSALDRRVGSFFFLWDIFNIFLGAMLVRRHTFTALMLDLCTAFRPKCNMIWAREEACRVILCTTHPCFHAPALYSLF